MARTLPCICNTLQKANQLGPCYFLSLLSCRFMNLGQFPIQQAQERMKKPSQKFKPGMSKTAKSSSPLDHVTHHWLNFTPWFIYKSSPFCTEQCSDTMVLRSFEYVFRTFWVHIWLLGLCRVPFCHNLRMLNKRHTHKFTTPSKLAGQPVPLLAR